MDVLIFFIVYFKFDLIIANNSIGYYNREPKYFGIGYPIGVVRFENKLCKSTEGLLGTCYTKRQCREIDGTRSNICASTFAFCCIVQRTCGAVTSHNNTYFVNPNFPSTFTGSVRCTIVIKKCSSEICQIRVDFLNFVLAPPSITGCTYDRFTITGGASIVEPICGENSGQHIYLGFNGKNDITITITTSSTYMLHRLWFINIAQIECDSGSKAPAGCLMYYTGTTGCVKSFNFGLTLSSETYDITTIGPGGMPLTIALPGTRELPNLNYGVCIAMEPRYCSIEWTGCSADSFGVSDSYLNKLKDPMTCPYDHVSIMNPTQLQTNMNLPFYNQQQDRFCGNKFGRVTSSSKPFILRVFTDNTEKYNDQMPDGNDIANIGFCLCFRQIMCTNF